ncbi:MAG: M24 family metallopeptidase [Thermodesulfovibrionales bacterium]
MDRLKKIKNSLHVDAILLTDLKNIRYFTGFTGSSAICLYTGKANFFITDFRYKEQSEKEVKGWDIIIEKKKFSGLKKLIAKINLKSLAFEPAISYDIFQRLVSPGLILLPLKRGLQKLREIKTLEEIEKIKIAIKRAEEGFLRIKELIKPGIMERDIAIELEYQIKKLGSGSLPFEVIVASGENSAMPHARSSMKKISPGDLVVIDWGAEAEGYFSDMTRTFLIKPASKDPYLEVKKKIYHIVKRAQEKALMAVRPGITGFEVDQKARKVIEREGYGKAFGHSTGHGVGLDIHELPVISMTSKERLKPGMVFTVEPGIYLSNIGGVRIEDMISVKEDGSEILTNLPRELEVI